MSDLDFSKLETLSVSIDQHIAHIQLSRPEALNSMILYFGMSCRPPFAKLMNSQQRVSLLFPRKANILAQAWTCQFLPKWVRTL